MESLSGEGGAGVLEDSAKENSGNPSIILDAENKSLLAEKAQSRVTRRKGRGVGLDLSPVPAPPKLQETAGTVAVPESSDCSPPGPPSAVQILSLSLGLGRDKSPC